MAVSKYGKSWWVDFRHDRRRIRKRSPVNSAAGAREYEAVLRRAIANGVAAPRIIPTLHEFAPVWFKNYVSQFNKPSEFKTKQSIMNVHLLPYFGSRRLDQIDRTAIDEFMARQLKQQRPNGKNLSRKTVNNHVAVLSKCLNTAVDWKELPYAPKIRLLKTVSRRIDFLTDLELETLLSDRTEPFWADMLLMAARTGMRHGELIALDWQDVYFESKLVHVRRAAACGIVGATKTYAERRIPLSADLAERLQERRRAQGLVYMSRDGEAFNKSKSYNAIRRICKRAGVRRIGWHLLRHTFASHLVQKGVSLRVVQELLGHKSIETTERYAHLAPSQLQYAIDLLGRSPVPETLKLGQQVVNGWPMAAVSP